MTKFVLHGGMTSVRNKNNKNFYKEIIKDLPKNPKILISLFANEESRWEDEYKNQKDNFLNNLGDLGFQFQMALKEKFLEQLDWADAVHFRGGSTLRLLEVIKNYPEFKEKISGETVSGSSAGAYFLADNFYENDIQEIHQGLGLVNINLIAHYPSNQYPPIGEEVLEKFQKMDSGKLILIAETNYKVFE